MKIGVRTLGFGGRRYLQQALALFQQLPDDPPSQSYVKRCRDAIASNAADWEAVWNLTSK